MKGENYEQTKEHEQEEGQEGIYTDRKQHQENQRSTENQQRGYQIMKLYAIKDKLDGFTAPIPFGTEEVAIRWFLTMCETNVDMSHNREDFTLWYMGEFDKETGVITNELKEVTL